MLQNGMRKYLSSTKNIYLLSLLALVIIDACNPITENQERKDNSNESTVSNSNAIFFGKAHEASTYNENIVDENTSDCKFEDGIFLATVDYHNPVTRYSQTYTLDVEIQNCRVVKIIFPKGGWLDEDHISSSGLDEDGNASIEGENGKTFDVHIDI